MLKIIEKLKKKLILIVAIIMFLLFWQVFFGKNNSAYLVKKNEADLGDAIKNSDQSLEVDPATNLGNEELLKDEELVNPKADSENNESKDNSKQEWPVYLVGAVKKPGIYHITESTCLYQLIDMAGGFLPDAAHDRINLASCLTPNQIIRIPTLEEWQENPDHQKYIKQAAEQAQAMDKIEGGKVNINTASSQELETLNGIGPATAKTIIDYREKNGPFAKIEDIMQVSGIKENRFAKFSDSVTVG